MSTTPAAVLAKIEAVRQAAPAAACERIANLNEVLQVMLTTKIDLQGLMPWSSNYTFLVDFECEDGGLAVQGIYKPGAGERPLWDFPDGNLCHREFASYLLSCALGWPNIPPTVLRDGPHGEGSVQLFIEAEYEAHYFNMRDLSRFTDDFRRIALFDYIANNADRKGGHCLKGKDGTMWAIDHGLTFHTDFKLRTVIWEFCDETITEDLLADLRHLHGALNTSLKDVFFPYLTRREVKALQKRIDNLLTNKRLPILHPGRNVPFPPV